MRTKGGTTGTVRPRHVGRLSPRRGSVGEPVVHQGGEPAVAPRGVEVPTISMRLSPLARTDRPTAASAADHSRQDTGNGASVCTRRSATGPAGDHRVASTMNGVHEPSENTLRIRHPVRRSLEAIRKPVAP